MRLADFSLRVQFRRKRNGDGGTKREGGEGEGGESEDASARRGKEDANGGRGMIS